jgi:phosphoribosylformylglycinamidine synthase
MVYFCRLIGKDLFTDNLVCYCVETTSSSTISTQLNRILRTSDTSHLINQSKYVIIGPKLHCKTPWCSNMMEIFKKCNIRCVSRIEQFILYKKHDKFIIDNMTQQIYKQLPESFDINITIEQSKKIPLSSIPNMNNMLDLSMDKHDIDFYTDYFIKINRNPTDVELFDLSQSNSEHSRHWIFNGKISIDEDYKQDTLFNLVKKPFKLFPNNSVVAFSDNSSAITGPNTLQLEPLYKNRATIYTLHQAQIDYTLTAETHNFPTGVAPFQGATTGVGGRIRDNLAIGRGGCIVAGTAGYCVGEINDTYDNRSSEIELCASDGASDYGNKIGEPIIAGFTRSFKQHIGDYLYEWQKPIMFTAGIGSVWHRNIKKETPVNNMLITRIGGPAYRIGLGGGSSSSRSSNKNTTEQDLCAVQRGDAEMENKVSRVVRLLANHAYTNVIKSIHDQGAGGMGNVTKEIVSPVGGEIFLKEVELGDNTLSALEIWGAEYQEQMTMLIDTKDKKYVKAICERENVPVSFVGKVKETEKIEVFDRDGNIIVDLNLNDILENIPQKEYNFRINPLPTSKLVIPENTLLEYIKKVFSCISVSSKRFLTNKVDRSVGGLIAQQQCVGPLHTPLSDYAIIAATHHRVAGCATSIGEQPIKAFIDSSKMVRMTVGEMLTNIIFAKITTLSDIKCSGNWMWSPKLDGEGAELYNAVNSLSNILIKLEIAIDGGKDSMSMHTNDNGNIIKTPRTLVMSSYAPMNDIRIKITPNFKNDDNNIIFVDLGLNKTRLGASALAQAYNQIGDNCPDFECVEDFKFIFNIIQRNIENGTIISGHDRSDGGLVTTILEMCFSGNKGCNINTNNESELINYMFNEELGLVLEINPINTYSFISEFEKKVPVYKIGTIHSDNHIKIVYNNSSVLDNTMTNLRQLWELNSFEFEKKRIPTDLAICENNLYTTFNHYSYHIPDNIWGAIYKTNINKSTIIPRRFKVAIIREEGSNGDKEMASAFHAAGFEVWDVNMYDLIHNPLLLDTFAGLAFVGGFSFSDVLGSANGWYNVILKNPKIKKQLAKFYRRPNTFSLGVCNGCQLMVKFGVIPGVKSIERNDSKRFESRFSTVKIPPNNSIMLHNMSDLKLGIWVAHGEGKFKPDYKHNTSDNSYTKKPDIFNNELITMQYVDHNNNVTDKYPYNPNGSHNGIAAVCSIDGRHLAMMPHPERCFLNWQMPWKPYDKDNKKFYSPWFLMFKNAFNWCNK